MSQLKPREKQGAKKTKKQRKFGRNTRKPGASQQAARTARNKAMNCIRCEIKAGRRKLPWLGLSPEANTHLIILRRRHNIS